MKVVIKKMFYKIYKQELESVTEINLKLKIRLIIIIQILIINWYQMKIFLKIFKIFVILNFNY